MKHAFHISVAIGLTLFGAATSALARYSDDKSGTPEHVAAATHQPRFDRYCVRAIDAATAERLRIRLYRRECKTAAHWAREGVELWRGGDRIR